MIMRKLFILLGVMVISLILTACVGNQSTITPPTFTGVRVEYTNPVNNGEFLTFYRGKQETVLVEVTLNNPDNAEIKSVVINGYTHLSNKFTENSTNSVIYFELNVGNTLAETIYSVDRINYFTGDNSVSVTVTANNEFKVYVYKDVPTVARENYALNRSQISIDFNINDVDQVIIENSLKAYLYAGETLIESKEIASGLTTVNFTELLANRLYEVKIMAAYDLDDSNGVQNNVVLYSGSYSTLANGLPSASVTNVNITSNKVTFNVDFLDDDDVVLAGGLSVVIYNDDQEVETINISGSTSGLSFDNLLNDNDYVIKVLADYDLKDGLGTREANVLATHSFSTLPREVPLPALLNLDLRENSIEFDVFIDDPKDIIDETSLIANLYIEGVFVDAANLFNYHVDFQVNNLFANKEFTIEIVADYDLNNGLGVQADQVIFVQTYSTLENAIPFIDLQQVVVTQGYITIGLNVDDPNQTLMGAMDAVLYEEGVAVQTIAFDVDTNELIFDYPTVAGLTYYIEFFADYNLRDGSGAVYNQTLRRIVSFTAEAKAPVAEIKNVTTTPSSISLTVDVLDSDGTISPGDVAIYLYLEGVLQSSQVINVGNNVLTFTNLLSNNEYQIVVLSDFNLEDGSGLLIDQRLIRTYVMTDTKVIPTSTSSNTDATDTSISLDVEFVDIDGVIEAGSVLAKLFYKGIEVDSAMLTEGENFGVTFTGLLSNNNYKVVFYVDYDLNDGRGIIEEYEVGEVIIRTDPKLAPTADFLFADADEESITVDILIEDDFGVLSGDLKAVLMLDNVATGEEVDLTLGINSNVTFNNVYAGERYYVNIIADYDLNDGLSVYDDEILASDYILTSSYSDVNAFINNPTATINSISFDVEVLDPSSVITGNLQAVLYLNDVATGAVQPLVVGNNVNVTFAGIDSATDYMVQIEVDYDLNEITGPVVGAILDFVEISTNELSAPTVSFVNQVPDYDAFDIDIFVDNSDGTITGNLKAVLYKDDVAQPQEVALVAGMNLAVHFDTLLSDNEYEVKVFSDYDLNDDAGEQLNVELGSFFVTTLAKEVPATTSSNLLISYTQITFDLNVYDTFNVMTSSTLKAGLYINDVLQTEKLLFTNRVSFNLGGFLADYDFEIRITGNYNLDDGNGTIIGGTIESYNFTTKAYDAPSATISDVEINQNTVDVVVDVVDGSSVITGNLIAILYDKDDVALETIVLAVGRNEISFTYTVNYNEFYSVVVYTDYNVLDGNGTVADSILAEYVTSVHNKLIPQASVTNVVLGEESITFDATVHDNDLVIIALTTKAELYLDGVKVDELPLSTGANAGESFTSLLSNREYVIRLVTNYNNGDGNGVYTHFEMTFETMSTLAKDVPSAEIIADTVTATQIIVDIPVVDSDAISSSRNAVLLDADNTVLATTPLVVGNNINVTFSGLLGDSEYTINVEITYDLNDGNGNQTTIVASSTQATLGSVVPTSTINSTTPGLSQISVNYSFTDQDNVSTEQYLRIYQNNSLVQEQSIGAGINQTYVFTELAPNTDYVVTLESSYDLNDLDGLQSDVVLNTTSVSTDSLIAIDNEAIDKKTSTLDVIVDDYEGIVTGAFMTATLYQDAVPVDTYLVSVDAVTSIDMIALLSNYDYTLEFEATYDNGSGDVTEVVYTHEFTTNTLLKPLVTIQDFAAWTLTPNVVVDVTIATDDDNVVVDTSWTAYLYVDGVVQDSVDMYLANGSANPEGAGAITITFSGYAASGTEAYTVIIRANVDMNDEPATGAVLTDMASKTGINAGN